MTAYTLNQDDRNEMQHISGYYDLIEKFLSIGRSNMAGGLGSRPELVDSMLNLIRMQAERAQDLHWPNLESRKLAGAKQDKDLQKLIKKASRKTLIQ